MQRNEPAKKLPIASNSESMTPIDVLALIKYENDSVVSKTLRSTRSGSITLFAFDEGQGLTPHTSVFEGFILILEGYGEITVSEEQFRVNQGQVIILPANKTHSMIAQSKLKMLLIMFKAD